MRVFRALHRVGCIAPKKGRPINNWSQVDVEIAKSCVSNGMKTREILEKYPNKQWEERTMRRLIARLAKGGNCERRKKGQGRKAQKTSAENVAKVSDLMAKPGNRSLSSADIGKAVGIGKMAAYRIVTQKLGCKSVKKVRGKRMSEKTKQTRLDRAKALLDSIKKGRTPLDKIWFSDEKMFRLSIRDKLALRPPWKEPFALELYLFARAGDLVSRSF